MRSWSAERVGALAGVGFVVLNVIANGIAGSAPDFNAKPAKIVSFFVDNHKEIRVGVVLTGIAAVLFVWLVAALALRLRALGQGGWALVVFAFGLTVGAAALVADALYGALSRIAAEVDPPFVQGVYQLSGFITVKALWFAAAATVAVAFAGWRLLPRWYALLSVVAGVLAALGGISVAGKGFLSPLGGMVFIAFLALLVWTLATSLVVWRGETAAETGAAAELPG